MGVTGDVSTRQWQVFNATGITHLVAISGMHVTFFAMLSMTAARRIWPRLAGLPGMPRRELFTAAVGILLALHHAGDLCVSDLAFAVGMSDSAVSHALRLLRAHGMVTAHRQGRLVRYRVAGELTVRLLDAVSVFQI